MAYKPVVILHGIFDNAASMGDLKSMIVTAHPGTNVTVINLFNDIKSITTPMSEQTKVVAEAVKKIMDSSKDGIHLIGYSQGTIRNTMYYVMCILRHCHSHDM